jgi:hypothetical protein
MKLETVFIIPKDKYATHRVTGVLTDELVIEKQAYVFTEYDLKMLLIDTFTSGSVRALNMDNDELAVKNYINNLFKD